MCVAVTAFADNPVAVEVKVIVSLCVIALMSSCATSRSHYQVKKGKVTKENNCPDCIKAW
jgi:hypothetical protein